MNKHQLQRGAVQRVLLLGMALLLCLAAAPRAAVLAQASPSTLVTVTTTADTVDGATTSVAALNGDPGPDGAVSLREALLSVAATAVGSDLTVAFGIPTTDSGHAAGIWTIPLDAANGALPPLARGRVTLDGLSQSNTLTPTVVLEGGDAFALGSGLTITAANNVVRGLTFQHFYDQGVLIQGQAAANNQIANCALRDNGENGLLITGGAANNVIAGSQLIGNQGAGVELRSGPSANRIGGALPAERNIISGNDFTGVLISGATTRENTVEGNWIGLDADGAGALPNALAGVRLVDTDENTIGGMASGAGNLISGNEIGISISNSDFTMVAGNLIGLAADGITPVSNTNGGILVQSGSRHNLIGGSSPTARNVISGNGAASSPYGQGIFITDAGTTNNIVQGNYIGIADDADAEPLARANLSYGIQISFDARDNLIGGSIAGSGNVIAANNLGGVRIDAPANQVAGNLIGVGPDGTTPFPNQNNGVRVRGDNNIVGPNNVIANHPLSAVILSGTGVQVISNTLSSNDRSGLCVTGAGALVTGNFVVDNGSAAGPWSECNIRGGITIDNVNDTLVRANTVYTNQGAGIAVQGGTGNRLLENSISDNANAGIALLNGGNNGIAPPQIASVTFTEARGTSCPSCRVELYTDFEGQGRYFVRAMTAQTDGTFRAAFTRDELRGAFLTATLTDQAGNTSPFAPPVSPAVEPDPSPTPGEDEQYRVLMPLMQAARR